MIPGRTVGEDGIAQNQFNNVGRSESLALNGESADRPSQDLETEDIHSTLEPGKTSSMTRRGFVASAVATFLAGCGSNNDQTGTERAGVETPQVETADTGGEATEAEDVPTAEDTQEDTPEADNVFENMTAYEQAVKDVRDRIDVNENVRRDVQNMFSDGDEIEALEEAMQHGAARAGFSQPAFYDSEKEYKTSGAVQAVARAVELYGEEDPDNTQEALGLHRINVDVKRVLLDGVETDVAIVEDTQEDETVLATNVNVAPGEEGSDADAYRVGTEPKSYTQEILKGLIDADDIGNGNYFDWETNQEALDRINDYDPEEDAREMSRYWGDIVAGASLTHGYWGGEEEVQHPMLFTKKLLRQHSEGPETGILKGTREVTNKVAETERDDSEIYILGEDYKLITAEYDLSRGIPQNLGEV